MEDVALGVHGLSLLVVKPREKGSGELGAVVDDAVRHGVGTSFGRLAGVNVGEGASVIRPIGGDKDRRRDAKSGFWGGDRI